MNKELENIWTVFRDYIAKRTRVHLNILFNRTLNATSKLLLISQMTLYFLKNIINKEKKTFLKHPPGLVVRLIATIAFIFT